MQDRKVTDMIYLVRCAVNNRKPDKQRIETMNHNAILSLASAHMMSTIVAIALESAGIKNQLTATAIVNGVRRDCFFEKAWGEISSELEKNNIWYLPLKGAVLKSYYKKPGMREYSDYDILIDKTKTESIKTIMMDLGFEMQHDDYGHDIVFYKKPVLNFEMHTFLFGSGHSEVMNKYYADISNRSLKDDDNKYGYHLSNEDFYIYMIAHEHKHYSEGGTGLRSLLDTYIYVKSVNLDFNYIENEIKKIGITEFEKTNRSLSVKLFSGQDLNSEEEKMLSYIISSGTYGTFEHSIENKIRKKGGSKIKYALSRFFVPIRKSNPKYIYYSQKYPKFYRNKLKICLLPFYRTYMAIKNNSFKRELKEVVNAKSDK